MRVLRPPPRIEGTEHPIRMLSRVDDIYINKEAGGGGTGRLSFFRAVLADLVDVLGVRYHAVDRVRRVGYVRQCLRRNVNKESVNAACSHCGL